MDLNEIVFEPFGYERLDKTIENKKPEVLEKLETFHKKFTSSLQPEKGLYGVSEIVKPDGTVEKILKNAEGLYSKQYFRDNKLIKARQQTDKKSWKYILYDDNETEYLEKIYKNGEKGLCKVSEKLLPNKIITKGNFTSVTDSQGRVISSKVYDLSINTSGRGTLTLDTEGKGYLEGDHRGHLVPDIFNGKGTLENVVPQLDSVNQGRMKKVENIARQFKEQGHKVDYEVKVNYGDGDNPLRPTSFEPKITVDGKLYQLDLGYRKIYNAMDLSKVDKIKTTMNEKFYSYKASIIENNKLGKEGALLAGGLTLSTSIAEDLRFVINGDMQVEDMALDVVQDTVSAGGLGYIEAFAEGTICTAMKNSGSKMISGLVKTGLPGMAIDFGIKSYESVSSFIEGKLDGLELVYDLGENAATTFAAFETGKAGAVLGSGLGPIGTVGGSLIGGMIGYFISSEVYAAAVDAGIEGVEILSEKANELGQFCIDAATECIPGFAEDVANSIKDFATQFDLPFSF